MQIPFINVVTHVKSGLLLLDSHKRYFCNALISRSALCYAAEIEASLKGSTRINKQ